MKIMIQIPAEQSVLHKEKINEILQDIPRLNDGDTLTLSYNLNWTVDKSLLNKLKALADLAEIFPGQLEEFDMLDCTLETCRLLQDIQNLVENRTSEQEWTD